MTNKTLKTTPANTGSVNLSNHESRDAIEWTSSIVQFPITVTPTHGDTTPFTTTNFSQVDNIVVYGLPYRSLSDPDTWTIVKPSSDQVCEFNITFGSSSSSYHKWMPATIFAGGGFLEQNLTGNNSNFRIRRIAFSFRNMDTNAVRIYSPGWDRAKTTSKDPRHAAMTSSSHYSVINSWGNRWRLYQTTINLRSNSTSAVQTPRMKFGVLRYFVHTPGLTGTTKIIVPQHMHWNDFLALDASGQRAFSSTY